MPFTEDEPGLFLVRYQTPTDMEPVAQEPLVQALKDSSARRPTAILFDIAGEVRGVPLSVPSFWLGIVKAVPLAAIAVVSASRAVRVAANAFGLAQGAIGSALEVYSSQDAELARGQLRSALAKSPGPGA